MKKEKLPNDLLPRVKWPKKPIFCIDCKHFDSGVFSLNFGVCKNPELIIIKNTPIRPTRQFPNPLFKNKHNNCKHFEKKECAPIIVPIEGTTPSAVKKFQTFMRGK